MRLKFTIDKILKNSGASQPLISIKNLKKNLPRKKQKQCESSTLLFTITLTFFSSFVPRRPRMTTKRLKASYVVRIDHEHGQRAYLPAAYIFFRSIESFVIDSNKTLFHFLFC